MAPLAESLPFAMIPHWVMLADVSNQAKVLYVLLVMHVRLTQPENRLAWPTRRRLARMMRLRREQSVDPYVTELEKLGAITVERGRHPYLKLLRRNYYTVRLPADGAPLAYFGCLSVWEDRRDLEPGDDEAAGQSGGAVQRTSGEQAGPGPGSEPSEVRSAAPPEVRLSAPREVRSPAQEVEVVDVDIDQEEVFSGSGSDEGAGPPSETSLQDPISLPGSPRPDGRADEADICGNPLCKGGVLHIGINRRPCPTCPQASSDQ
jgi:hypothetical protein